MKLSERKKKILSAVVDESIKTAEPVSSNDVHSKYLSEFSPATIRNELMALEEMGFLSQPHTSSGRVPTAEGYQMYVNELMDIKKLSKKEADNLKESFDTKLFNLDDVLQKAAKTISDATNYASVVYYGITGGAVVENILLIKLSQNNTLVVVVTDLGVIKEETSAITSTEDDLRQASKILTKMFKGKKLEEVEHSENLITKELARYKQIFDYILHLITERDEHNSVAVSGKDKLLNYPEYQDVYKLKHTMNLLDQKDKLSMVMSEVPEVEFSIKVGGDENLGITDCSIVTTTYKSRGKPIGSLGVVGPVRMDYGKVVSILKNVTKLLEDNQFFKEDKDE